MGNMIKVGMADLKACKCPDALTTLGLGNENRWTSPLYVTG